MSATQHAVTLAFYGGSPYARLTCHAPAEALCHASWTCDCERWESDGVQDGLPYHENGGADGRAVRHYGTFDPTACNLRNWFDDNEELLHGEVTFPIRAEWDGDYYTFRPVTPKEDR